MNPDQAGCFIVPDLGPNCSQRLSAVNKISLTDKEFTLSDRLIKAWIKGLDLTALLGCYNKTLSQCMSISNYVECVTSKAFDQPVQTHSLIRAFASRLSIL